MKKIAQVRFYSRESARNFIEKAVKENDLVVFMKGTPRQPMCGFSRTVCQLLDLHGVSQITAVNVLDNEDVRAEIKTFTNWPTIPQVFIKGQFIGGCDILMEMNQSGTLRELLLREKLVDPTVMEEQEPQKQKEEDPNNKK